ncbi:hypothetical protein BB559_001859 [Furculomyces boomerangus]|uniref:Uncharacterized protein n=2 Tax=Harpellales TaxID=61421 RepID=A0A2T9YZY1_9FUNG|nr:hypothetical protein BB559_001859 [Furculomyces boomerangus]PWA03481.1 hypothetical protein BB558_000349 [Smittium angustum]
MEELESYGQDQDCETFKIVVTNNLKAFCQINNQIVLENRHYTKGLTFSIEDGCLKTKEDLYLFYDKGLLLSNEIPLFQNRAILKIFEEYDVSEETFYMAVGDKHMHLDLTLCDEEDCDEKMMLQVMHTNKFFEYDVGEFEATDGGIYTSADGIDLFREDVCFGLNMLGRNCMGECRYFEDRRISFGSEYFCYGIAFFNLKRNDGKVYLMCDKQYVHTVYENDEFGGIYVNEEPPEHPPTIVEEWPGVFTLNDSRGRPLMVEFYKASYGELHPVYDPSFHPDVQPTYFQFFL